MLLNSFFSRLFSVTTEMTPKFVAYFLKYKRSKIIFVPQNLSFVTTTMLKNSPLWHFTLKKPKSHISYQIYSAAISTLLF